MVMKRGGFHRPPGWAVSAVNGIGPVRGASCASVLCSVLGGPARPLRGAGVQLSGGTALSGGACQGLTKRMVGSLGY